MTWKESIGAVLQEQIQAKGLKPTNVAIESGISRNFFTRLFSNRKRFIDLDGDLEPLAAQLGTDVWTILTQAQQKMLEKKSPPIYSPN